jgi:hypothetical protein
MSLIELLYTYAYIVRNEGRLSADKWLMSCSDSNIIQHVRDTVNDKGQFINSDGSIWK